MSSRFETLTTHLTSVTDMLRFAVSQANQEGLYYGHGSDNAYDDMLSLILHTLHLPHDLPEFLLAGKLTQDEKKQLIRVLEKRILSKIPVPYLTHEAYFCGLPFYVDERVLIPRSPIAELIEKQFSPWVSPDNVHRVLDLCTGSGCIAIACCYAFPEAQVDAVDLSQDALAVAHMNVEEHSLSDQCRLIRSDCFERVEEEPYDLIVSNPPYVGSLEMQTLPDEYKHEPKMALETEENGLAIVERILTNAKHFLSSQGVLVVEVGNSEEALVEKFPNVPFVWLDFEKGGQGVFLLTYNDLKEYF